jgi:hypothetical protein
MPSPNQSQADLLVAQFKQQGIEVPADVQKIVDSLLAVREHEPAGRLPVFTYVDFDGKETEWVLTIQSVMDRGFVIRSGDVARDLTEEEAADALAANKAGYWQPDLPPVNIIGSGDAVGSV